MAIELNTEDARLIRSFIPINTLPGYQFDELCASHQISCAGDGEQLFTEGSVDTDYYFLLEGNVSLEAGKTEVDSVNAGSANARFALAHHIPRKVTCIAQGPVRYLKVDSEMFSEESVSQMLQQNGMVSEESELVKEEAIPFLLKAPLFRQLSVSVLPKVSACLEEVIFEAGQTIIDQGNPNDVFYIIQEGQCKVTHRPFEDAREIQLEDLQQGDTFGEYALLIDGIADVTVKAATDCVMYTIDENSFDQCIQQPLVNEISWNAADQSGDVFLDIQQLDEYRKTHVKGSINYPFSTLRVRMGQLADTDHYIVISNDDKMSQAAVIMLRQQQLNAKVLAGGLQAVPDGSLDHILTPETDSDLLGADTESEALQFGVEQLYVQHSVIIGSPISPLSDGEDHPRQSSESQLPELGVVNQEHQSEFSGVDKKEGAVIGDNETMLTADDSYAVNLHIKKLEKKLQEVWKAYKKSRRQLHRSRRKYAAVYREYNRIEQTYHSFLIQDESSDETVPIVNPAITADEINQRLREEFSLQVEENEKLKQQNSLLKQKLAESKQTSGSSQVTKRQTDSGSSTTSSTENEALLLQIQELEDTVRDLEQNKISQKNKAKEYVDENNKLRQLIQELAKQAIDEQAQDRSRLSSFDFATEFASSDNAYDAESALSESSQKKQTEADSVLSISIEDNAEGEEPESMRSDETNGDNESLFDDEPERKIQASTWIGIASTALLAGLVVFLFVNTKEGQLLLKQLGF